MLKENNKKKTIRRLTKVCLFVLLLAGSFLFGANSRAANNDYNKIATSTLTAVEWNNLINDFVNTWKSDSMVGPLGIGTTNPLYSLDVNGTGSFNQPLIVGTPTASNHAATKNYVDSIIGGGSGSTVGYWTMNGININNSNAGNVGIGTASPASKLDVVGNAAISGTLTVPTINGLSISNFYGPNNAITWNVTAPASYTNNNVVAPDFTTTAATLNFTAGNGSHWDLYNAMSGLTPGASYTVSLYVKLGTSTNFSLVVNNAAAWNTIGGRVFTAADGLSTSAWKQISYTFTEPVGKTTANIHIGANQETALTGTPQVVGSVYVWGFQVVQNNAGTLALQPTVGNVGIGVSAPGSKLSIRGASGSNALEIQRASDGASMITVDDWGQLNASHGFMISAGGGYSGNSVLDVRSSSAGHIPFSVLGYSGQTGNLVNITSNGGTQGNLFNIQANGNVGIGTTNPLAPLAIVTPSSGNYEAIRINRDATGATYWSLGSVYNNTNPDLIFKVNGGEKIRFDVNGNVGIGTTSPLFKLDVNGTGSFNQPVVVGTPTIASHAATKNYVDSAIGGGSGSTVGYWAMNGTNINNSNAGNVGVGTTTPGFKLDVNGNARFTDIYNSGTVLKKSPYEYYGSVYLSNTLDSTNNTAYVNIGTFQDGFTHINVEVELVPWLFSTGNIGSYQKSYTIRMTAASPGIVNVYDSRVIKDVGQTGDRYQIGTPEADANNLLRIPIKYIGAGGGNQIQAFVRVTGTMSGNIDDVSLSAVAATPVSAGTQEYMSFRNRLGIGITNPLGTLHVSNASSTNALVVSSGGQIGVGIATPQSIGTNYGTIDVRGPSGGGFFFGPSAGPSGLFYSNGSQLYMGSYTNIPLNLQTNNLVRATIDGGGNVGIGTTSPLYKLDVNGTGSFNQPVIVGTPTIASHAATKNYVDSALSGGSGSTVGYWVMNGTNINNSNAGNVGIGTTNPGGVLQVTGTENSRVILSQSTFDYAKKSPKLSFFAYGDNGLITGPSIQKTSTGSYGAGNLGFIQHPTGDYTTEVEVMTITPTGNVGIGTTLPNGKLDIRDANNAAIYLSSSAADATSATSKIYSGYGGSGGWANTYLRFATSPASGTFNDSMTILGNGNIGVGTTNPLQLLDVRSANATAPIIAAGSTLSSYSANSVVSTISLGSYYTTGLQFYSAGQISGVNENNVDSAYGALSFSTRALAVVAEKMRITGAGNVGISTTSPQYKLDVNGTGSFNQPVIVGTPTIASHAATKNYVDSALSGGSGSTVGYWAMNGTNINNSNAGNVGIGTTNPGSLLDLYKAGNNYLYSMGNGTVSAKFYLDSATAQWGTYTNHPLIFYTNNTNAMGISSSGGVGVGGNSYNGYANAIPLGNLVVQNNVGIGTTNPGVKFDVTGSIATRIVGTEDEFHLTRLVSPGVSNVQLAAFKLGTYSNSGTNPATRLDIDLKSAGDNNLIADKNIMTLLDNGNVGIGTTSPADKLDVRVASGDAIAFGGGVTQVGVLGFDVSPATTYLKANSGSYSLGFRAGNSSSDHLTISPTGNVGISTTTPLYKLDVNGTGSFNQPVIVGTPIIANHAATKNYVDSAMTGAANTFWASSTLGTYNVGLGNVGVGTTAPDSRFKVTLAVSGANPPVGTTMAIENNGDTRLSILSPYANSGFVSFGNPANSNNRAYIKYDHTADLMTFSSAGNTNFSNGNVGVGVAGPLAKLQVNGSSLNTNGLYHYRNLAGIETSGVATGTLKIIMPVGWTNTMGVTTIRGYNYSGVGAWEVVVGGYNFSGAYWVNTSAEIKGRAPFSKVRLGYNGTNVVILLGDVNTSWFYGKAEVSDFLATHAGQTGWGSGWSMSFVTDESDISAINTPSIYTYLDNSGNQGIGTTNPQYKLDVAGAGSFTQPVIVGTPTIGTNAATKNYVDSAVIGSGASLWASSTAGTYNVGSGNVGIGTTNPGAKLEVNGDMRISYGQKIFFRPGTEWSLGEELLTVNGAQIVTAGALVSQVYNAANQGFMIRNSASSSLFEVNGDGSQVYIKGNVGIGVTNPTNKLEVSGGNIAISPGSWVKLNGAGGNQGITYDNVGNFLRLVPGNGGVSIRDSGNTLDRLTVLNAGNVGISTSTPIYKLDVVGAGNFNSNIIHGVGTPLAVDDAAPKSYVDSAVSGSGASLWASSTAGTYNVGLGSVGIGTTNPGSKLEILGAASSTPLKISFPNGNVNNNYTGIVFSGETPKAGILFASNAAGFARGNLIFATSNSMDYSGINLSNERLRITDSGNVGIGVTNPVGLLDVNGDISFAAASAIYPRRKAVATDWYIGKWDSGSNSIINAVGTSGTGSFQVGFDSGTFTPNVKLSGGGTGVSYISSGNVGIGMTAPAASLNVAGEMRISNASTLGKLSFWNADSTGYYGGVGTVRAITSSGISTDIGIVADSGRGLHFYTNTAANERMTIDATGNVGIATTSPIYKLDVVGAGNFNNNIIHGVGTPLAVDDAAPKSYVDSAISATGASLWASSTAGIYNVGLTGKIGIGTTNPADAITINKNTNSLSEGSFGLSIRQNDPGTPTQLSFGTLATYSAIQSFQSSANWSNRPLALQPMGGNVGIGTTNPGYKLEVSGNIRSLGASNTIDASVDSSNVLRMLHSGSYGSIQSFVGGGYSTLVLNKDGGNVGIGTTSPLYKLDVFGTGSFTQPVIVGTPTIGTNAATKNYVDSAVIGSGASLWASSTAGTYNVGLGNVGIGTTGPTTPLHVFRSGGVQSIFDSGTRAFDIFAGATNSIIDFSNEGGFKIRSKAYSDRGNATPGSAVDRFYIDGTTGNVGIGTTNPAAPLDFGSGTNATQLLLSDSGTSYKYGFGTQPGEIRMFADSAASKGLTFGTINASTNAFTEQMRITGTGNIGIGTTTPQYKLDVNGTGSFNQPIIVGSPTAANHAATKNYVDSIIGGGSGSTVGYWTMNGTSINNSNVGNVGIGTTNPLYNIEVSGTFKASASSSAIILDANGNISIGI